MRLRAVISFICIGFVLLGCVGRESFSHGFRATDEDIAQVPVGSSAQQVELVFGSPSTVSISGSNPIWYYITQESESDLFNTRKVTDQRVLAVTFDDSERVSNIANYGLQDGQIFDFVSKTTPTGGQNATFLQRIFSVDALSNAL